MFINVQITVFFTLLSWKIYLFSNCQQTAYNNHCISPATHNTWLPTTINVLALLPTTHDFLQQSLYQSCYTQPMTPYNNHCISPATHNTWLPTTLTVSVLLYTTHDSLQQSLYQSCYTQHMTPYNNHMTLHGCYIEKILYAYAYHPVFLWV